MSSDGGWTRAELTEQLFRDLRGLLAYQEEHRGQLSVPVLMAALRGGATAIRQGTVGTTHELLMLACLMIEFILEVTLAEDESETSSVDTSVS